MESMSNILFKFLHSMVIESCNIYIYMNIDSVLLLATVIRKSFVEIVMRTETSLKISLVIQNEIDLEKIIHDTKLITVLYRTLL